jgi:hypothetical protein
MDALSPSRRRLLRRTALTLALSLALPAWAQEQSLRIDYEVGLSGMHTDNIELVETGEDSETVFAPTLTLEARKDSSAVQLRARGGFQFLDYRSGAYEDEWVGDFAGQLNWYVLPDRLAFAFADYLGRTPVDITGGLTPGNQQQINVFTAGPTLFLRPGEVTRAQIDLRFTDTRSDEVSDFDGSRFSAAVRGIRELSPLHSVSANLDASEVDFEAAPGTDYRRYDGYAGYVRDSERTDMELAAGYSRIERKDTAGTGLEETLSGPLARLRIGWQLAPHSRVDLHARHEFADSATDLVARSDRFDEPVIEDLASPNVIVGASLFRMRRLEVGYQYENERVQAYLRPYVERVTYEEESGAYWNAHGVYFDVNYRLRPRLDLELSVLGEERELVEERRDRDWSLRLGVSYRFSRRLTGFLAGQRRERDSDLAGADYRENMVMAGITFRR